MPAAPRRKLVPAPGGRYDIQEYRDGAWVKTDGPLDPKAALRRMNYPSSQPRNTKETKTT